MMRHSTNPFRPAPCASAFTIIELLVVISIIAVLSTIVLVAVGGILGSARDASAQRQLQSIAQGIEQFENDLGRLPPLLTRRDGEDLFTIPEAESSASDAFSRLREARFSSMWTLGVYLLGAGDLDGSERGNQTGTNTDDDDGLAGPGFRDPGPDFSWGGAEDRRFHASKKTATKVGRTFGPYLDMDSMADAIRLDTETGLFVILDPWDQPIRYYKDWPTRARDQRNVSSIDRVPIELRSPRAVEEHIANKKAVLELDRPVLNSRFILLCAGEPIRFESDGTPIPLFGELNELGNQLQGPGDFEQGSFDPSTLDSDELRFLLERLESNIRVSSS